MNPIHTIELRTDEEIQISLKEFKGNLYVDMRVFFTSSNADIKLPSRKGLTFNAIHFQSFLDGMTKVEYAMKEKFLEKEVNEDETVN